MSYKDLKKRLKGCMSSNSCATGESATSNEPGSLHASANPVEDHFVRLLNMELEKFNNFFMEKEEEFVIRMQELKERMQKEKITCDILGNCDGCIDKVNGVRKAIVVLHGEMVLLENYSSLNYTGLVKILKKHDKRTGLFLRHPFISNVLRQPFFTTELVSKLIKECESMLQDLFPPTSFFQAAEIGTDDTNASRPPDPCLENGISDGGENLTAYKEQDTGIAAVYRNTITALRSLQEMRGSSKTPHPLLLEEAQLTGHPIADLVPIDGLQTLDDDSDDGSTDIYDINVKTACEKITKKRRVENSKAGLELGDPLEAVGSSADAVSHRESVGFGGEGRISRNS